MVRMNLSELTIHRNEKDFIDLLSVSPHIEIEGSVSSSDIQALNDMFNKGSIFLITRDEATEYLAFKLEEAAKEVETKEENNDEECD